MALSPSLNSLNQDELTEVSFINGLTSSGTTDSVNFHTWNSDQPPTYTATSVAGTYGGAISYYFDTASNWTATQTAGMQAAMQLWSDEVGITFVQATSEASADAVYFLYNTASSAEAQSLYGEPLNSGTGYTEMYNETAVAPGSTALPTATRGLISFDPTVSKFSQIGNLNYEGSLGVESLVHELGHLLGLAHAGPYDGSSPTSPYQFTEYDTRMWATMSYIRPDDTAAAYYANYPVTGTNWGSTPTSATDATPVSQVNSTTEPLDIAAAQQLYGAATTGALQGGQVFGFNTNITDATSFFYDFTNNTTPIVTIWDGGTGNALDLSGFTQGSTVNLNPGTFSSADGLVNNIGIAFNTAIDSAVGGVGNDVFTLNNDNDTIIGGGGADTVVVSAPQADVLLTRAGNVITMIDNDNNTTSTFTDVSVLKFSDGSTLNAADMPCFAEGVLVATRWGTVPVERIRVGDEIALAAGGWRPVIWIGRRHVDCRSHASPEKVLPIRILAGTFADDGPLHDLLLSPDHAIFADGVLIPVKHLVNNATIRQIPYAAVTYYHLELDQHDVILAEGLPCESFLDNGSRTAFANGAVMQLHPTFSAAEQCEAMGEAAGCAPLRIEGAERARLDAMLRRLAVEFGHHGTDAARPARDAAIATTADLAALLQPDWYHAVNADVAAAGADPACHYAAHGRAEGRLPCPEPDLIRGLGLVDPATIARTMPDVVAAGVGQVEHFCRLGWQERRRPNAFFDTSWYFANHDVPTGMSPLAHYVLFGESQDLAPNPHFDPAWYRGHYALAPSACALAHYLAHRRTGQFSPRPDFDVHVYRHLQATLRPHRDPYAHFLAFGRHGSASGCHHAA